MGRSWVTEGLRMIKRQLDKNKKQKWKLMEQATSKRYKVGTDLD